MALKFFKFRLKKIFYKIYYRRVSRVMWREFYSEHKIKLSNCLKLLIFTSFHLILISSFNNISDKSRYWTTLPYMTHLHKNYSAYNRIISFLSINIVSFMTHFQQWPNPRERIFFFFFLYFKSRIEDISSRLN